MMTHRHPWKGRGPDDKRVGMVLYCFTTDVLESRDSKVLTQGSYTNPSASVSSPRKTCESKGL